MSHVRDYVFYDTATSICSTCYRRVDAKILFQNGHVLMKKRCPEHGIETVLVADDIDYYRRAREVFLKPSEMPRRFNTPIKYGCPYDCGLCPDHEQHSCLTLIEVGDGCNLECPICYAESSPTRMTWRPIDQIERMLDAAVANEGEPDVVQISGGEPTLHPDFFAILDAAKARPIKHLMVNTNGVRIAKDRKFVERLAGYMPGFEVYLQFDSFEAPALRSLRGADLRDVRTRALKHLNDLGVSTNLVVTVKRGLNDQELGKIIDFGLEQPAVRGVTFQPVQEAGRLEGFDPAKHRMTLTEVRRRILEQTDVFQAADILPVPCHPDAIAMAYALKRHGRVTPLTSMIDEQILIEGARNTITFEHEKRLQTELFHALSTGHGPQSSIDSLKSLLCCLPGVSWSGQLGYEHLFRVIIMQFADAAAFDLRSVKKSCVHIVHPDDGRLIPFDTYNLFYRDNLEATRLAPLKEIHA